MGLLKKHALSLAEGSASGVLGPLSCSRTYEYAPRAKAPAALPVEGRVLARLGWAGQTTGFFEQPQ